MKFVVLYKYMNCTVNKTIDIDTGHTIYIYYYTTKYIIVYY